MPFYLPSDHLKRRGGFAFFDTDEDRSVSLKRGEGFSDRFANLAPQSVPCGAAREKGAGNGDVYPSFFPLWVDQKRGPLALRDKQRGAFLFHRESRLRPFRRLRDKRRRPPLRRMRRRNPWTFFRRKLDFLVNLFFIV